MTFEEQLRSHLQDGFMTAPFLFVGSGFSRRYANTPDWVGLLRELADKTGKPYERYSSAAAGDLPTIASAIGNDFFDIWWDNEEYADHRAAFPNPVSRTSPLKYEIAQTFARAVDALPAEGELNAELESLRNAVLEGVITTNYDTILEYIFPDFVPFVGQEELLFKEPLGIAEIYKIHGSSTAPESLVITSEDFANFRERNPYLAAKLLTVFVEHPILFIGYSLTDDNVREIITSIASVLTPKNIDRLRDRLLFVQWDPAQTEPTMVASMFPIEGQSIPIQLLTVSNFMEVFEVLGTLRRRFPARILRHLKDEVYSLVRTSSPTRTVVVSDLEADTDLSTVDVVIGVGVSQDVTRNLAAQGITGLKRRDLLDDTLSPKLGTTSFAQIVEEVIPKVANVRTHVPIYRYLRGAGLLADDGSLVEDAKVAASIRAKIRLGQTALQPSQGYPRDRATKLVTQYSTFDELSSNASVADTLLAAPMLAAEAINPDQLAKYLRDHQDLLDSGKLEDVTRWNKCVCLYDLLVNKLPPTPSKSTRRPTPAKQGQNPSEPEL